MYVARNTYFDILSKNELWSVVLTYFFGGNAYRQHLWMPIFCSHRRSQYLNFTKKVAFWVLKMSKLWLWVKSPSSIQLVCCFVIHRKKCKMSKFPSHRKKVEETWAVSAFIFLSFGHIPDFKWKLYKENSNTEGTGQRCDSWRTKWQLWSKLEKPSIPNRSPTSNIRFWKIM